MGWVRFITRPRSFLQEARDLLRYHNILYYTIMYCHIAPDPLSWRTTSPKNGSSCWLRHAGCGLTFRAAKDRHRTALSCQPSPSPRRAVEESGASTPNPEPPLMQLVIVCGPVVVKPCLSCASGRVGTPEPRELSYQTPKPLKPPIYPSPCKNLKPSITRDSRNSCILDLSHEGGSPT